MLLEEKYYRVLAQKRDGLHGVFHIALLRDCDVYRGHFPGRPVSPGVCNIETIKELTMALTGKSLCIQHIKSCRFTAVASPDICPEVDVEITVVPSREGYAVAAIIRDAKATYLELKGEMTA